MSYILYHYYPSLTAAAIFIMLFSAVTAVHIVLLLKNRTWYFIAFVVGGICKLRHPNVFLIDADENASAAVEFAGYTGRAISAKQSPNWTIGPYIQQSLLLLLAPALFAASIYMILGRIIRLVDAEQHSLIRTKFLTKIFVAGDVLSFFVQSGGELNTRQWSTGTHCYTVTLTRAYRRWDACQFEDIFGR